MAVTPTTLTELNDLAKDYYAEVYVPLMNTETPLRSQFQKLQNATFTGRTWIFGIKTDIGGGSSNAGSNKTLPAAAEGTYDQGQANVVRQYTRLAADGLMIEVTKKREGSYRPALAELMEDRLAAHDLETNRQLFCNGDGKLCLIGGTPGASATQTVASDYGVTNGGQGTRHIRAGDQVAIYTTAGSLIGRRVVSSVSHANSTMTLDSSITTTATTNFVTKSTADDDNYTAGEINGLLISVSRNGNQSSGTLFENVPVTVDRWNANVFDNNGTLRPLTDELVMTALAKHKAESRQDVDLAVCRPGVVLKYSLLFLPIRRIDGQETQLKGGFKPVKELMGGGNKMIPVLEDLDCPNSRLFLLSTKAYRMADLIGTDWADWEGAQFVRITDKDGCEGYIRSYRQLMTIQRNALTVIEDLEDIESIDRLGLAA